MQRKLCPGCNKEHPIGDFNWKIKAKGKRQVRCRHCTRAQLQSHYLRHRKYYLAKARKRNAETAEVQRRLLLEYLSIRPCVDCGESDVVCLEFDHVRGRKQRTVATMIGHHSWATILAELAKCDVRCANCHRRKTARAEGWYRTRMSDTFLACTRSSTG